MLLIDFRSAFNNVVPSKLLIKLAELGITTLICNWLLDFETDTSQHVWLDHCCFSTLTVNTGVPQGCVLSPFFYSLFTHDCRHEHGSNAIIKFADDTTVIDLNKHSNELAYREEVDLLAAWSEDNNLTLNTSKTKELIMDFRKNAVTHSPIHIIGVTVEHVTNFKFLGIHISQDLSITTNCSSLVKKAHQCLFFLRTLKIICLDLSHKRVGQQWVPKQNHTAKSNLCK